jgi:hypothetical protein
MAKYDVPLSASLRILLSLIPVRSNPLVICIDYCLELCLKEQSQEHKLQQRLLRL